MDKQDLRDLKGAYRFIFGSNEGKKVLEDLRKHCNYDAFVETPYEEGARRMYLHILKRIKDDVGDDKEKGSTT
jgi:hypothetical protein